MNKMLKENVFFEKKKCQKCRISNISKTDKSEIYLVQCHKKTSLYNMSS